MVGSPEEHTRIRRYFHHPPSPQGIWWTHQEQGQGTLAGTTLGTQNACPSSHQASPSIPVVMGDRLTATTTTEEKCQLRSLPSRRARLSALTLSSLHQLGRCSHVLAHPLSRLLESILKKKKKGGRETGRPASKWCRHTRRKPEMKNTRRFTQQNRLSCLPPNFTVYTVSKFFVWIHEKVTIAILKSCFYQTDVRGWLPHFLLPQEWNGVIYTEDSKFHVWGGH